MIEIAGRTPAEISLEQANHIAGQTADAYARRCWWADREVLRHTAWCSMLQAARSGRYDGGPVAPYLATAAYRGVAREIYKTGSPVSGSDKTCIGTRKVSVQWLDHHTSPDAVNPEHTIGEEEWCAQVRAAVLAEIADDDLFPAGLAVLLGGERPREVARKFGVDRRALYRAVDRMKRRLRRSPALLRLARDIG